MKEHASEPFAQLQRRALKFEWRAQDERLGRGGRKHEVLRPPLPSSHRDSRNATQGQCASCGANGDGAFAPIALIFDGPREKTLARCCDAGFHNYLAREPRKET